MWVLCGAIVPLQVVFRFRVYELKSSNDVKGNDYTICKLYTPLGNTVSCIGSYSPSNDNEYKSGHSCEGRHHNLNIWAEGEARGELPLCEWC